MNILDFKPSKSPIPRAEKKLLISNGFNWCPLCSSVQPISEFFKKQYRCKACSAKIRKQYALDHPTYQKEYRSRDRQKWLNYDREWARRFRDENKERYNERDRKWRGVWGIEYRKRPKTKFRHRLGEMIRRMKDGKGGRKTMDILGVSSQDDFVQKLSLKTSNPNWVADGWQIDHVWQIQWFSEALKAFPEETCSLINHHRNLRPLSQSSNYKRSCFDFSPLSETDLPLYERYLDKDILERIKKHFEG